jgi:hypothetical protein
MDESSEADSGTADHQPLEPQATYAWAILTAGGEAC